VKVPRVMWELSSSQVLTMEYTPGVKINRGEARAGGGARAASATCGCWHVWDASTTCGYWLLFKFVASASARHAPGRRGRSQRKLSVQLSRGVSAVLTGQPFLPLAVKELDRLGVDRTVLAQRAVESYLQQLLNHGFFHAGGWAGFPRLGGGGWGGAGGGGRVA
jgi:hypothetical protein